MHFTAIPGLRPLYRTLREGAAHFVAGRYLASIERFTQALAMCARHDRTDSLRLTALLYKGKCQHHLGRYLEAVKSYDEALGLGGDHVPVWFWKAQAERSAGRHAEAAQSLHKFLELATRGDPARSREAREWLTEWGFPGLPVRGKGRGRRAATLAAG